MHYLIFIMFFLLVSCTNINQNIGINSKEDSVEIAIDKYGIPYINAKDMNDGLYALGYMHGKDRIFQLDFLRHLALGRLAELIGDKGLYFDKKTRLLNYLISEQEQSLLQTDKNYIKNYVDGINQALKENPKSIEHCFLKIDCKPFSITDIIAISRFYVWILGNDLHSELARFHIAHMNITDELKNELLAPISSDNSQIFMNEKNFNHAHNFSYDFITDKPILSSINALELPVAASNAWAVNGNIMENNNAVLMNDPHLKHEFPSNFYMASIQVNEQIYAGASLVGLPAIVIGMGNNISFGVTAALTNTQDAIILKHNKEKNTYKVDKQEYKLESWSEIFCSKDKKTCETKTYYKSIFGPIIDNEFYSLVPKNMVIALRWSGFLYEHHKEIITPFINLAQSKNVAQAIDVINKMTFTGVNFLLADTQKNIGYAFAGLLLQKSSHQNPFLPLDGSVKHNINPIIISGNNKKSIINPSNNFLITANQNLFAKLNKDNSYGLLGAESYRAQRIKQKILQQKQLGNLNINNLQSIQVDSTSLEAKELAPLLGEACLKYMDYSVESNEFSQLLKNFDGDFNPNSHAALPYQFLISEIINERVISIFNNNTFNGVFHINNLIKKSLVKTLTGYSTAMFASVIDWPNYMKNRCNKALEKLVQKTGKNSWRYRYGRHHYMQRKSLISAVPIIGKFFKDMKREVGGYHSAPMAQGGLPVNYGANLRMYSEMSIPPKLNMVIDSGNNGDFHHVNSKDQAVLWHDNKFITFYDNFFIAKANAKKRIKITKSLKQ